MLFLDRDDINEIIRIAGIDNVMTRIMDRPSTGYWFIGLVDYWRAVEVAAAMQNFLMEVQRSPAKPTFAVVEVAIQWTWSPPRKSSAGSTSAASSSPPVHAVPLAA